MASFKKIIVENVYTKNKTQQKLCFRSLWEVAFAKWLDTNANVVSWRNDLPLSYKDTLLTNKPKTYYVDFAVDMTDGKKYLFEIKPLSAFSKQVATSSYRYKYIHETNRRKNISKFDQTAALCRAKGWRFYIVEKTDTGFHFYRWNTKVVPHRPEFVR